MQAARKVINEINGGDQAEREGKEHFFDLIFADFHGISFALRVECRHAVNVNDGVRVEDQMLVILVAIVVGIKPMDVLIASQPCKLTFGVMTRGCFDGVGGFLQGHFSADISEKLLVSDRAARRRFGG
jgi:hypothetical protein